MKLLQKVGWLLISVVFFFSFFSLQASAQEESGIYRAKVLSERIDESKDNSQSINQILDIEIIHGPQRGRKEIVESTHFSDDISNRIKKGDNIYVTLSDDNNVFFADRYRLNKLVLIIIVFFSLVVAFSGLRGLWSITGLIASIGVISLYIIPRIVDGQDPFVVSILGVLMAAFLTFYLAHGFNRRTTFALFGTLITLVFAVFFAIFSTRLLGLSGNFSEETFYLTVNVDNQIDLRGLFLSGIMLSTLGVLDDITTAQVAAVENIKKTNPKISFKELYNNSFDIGREHIVGLVNTLAFAYLGGSLVTILGYFIYQSVPWWYYLNTEFIIAEIVQTVVGSSSLVLAVPITTWIACKHYTKLKDSELIKLVTDDHAHHHH